MEKGYIVINLLPYREKIKKEKLKQFGILVGSFAIAAGLLVFMGSMYLDYEKETQTSRNTYIENKNKELENQIKEIVNLKDEIKDTLAKRQVVENLQIDRSDGVNILNTLSTQLPEGVTLKSVKQNGEKLSITGNTAVNAKIANYMSNLEATDIFQNAQIIEVKLQNNPATVTTAKGKKIVDTIQESEFLITIDLTPKIVAKDEPKNSKAKNAVKASKD